MKDIISELLRLILITFIIVNVWLHSHWSVALSITSSYIGSELSGFVVKHLKRNIDSIKGRK